MCGKERPPDPTSTLAPLPVLPRRVGPRGSLRGQPHGLVPVGFSRAWRRSNQWHTDRPPPSQLLGVRYPLGPPRIVYGSVARRVGDLSWVRDGSGEAPAKGEAERDEGREPAAAPCAATPTRPLALGSHRRSGGPSPCIPRGPSGPPDRLASPSGARSSRAASAGATGSARGVAVEGLGGGRTPGGRAPRRRKQGSGGETTRTIPSAATAERHRSPDTRSRGLVHRGGPARSFAPTDGQGGPECRDTAASSGASASSSSARGLGQGRGPSLRTWPAGHPHGPTTTRTPRGTAPGRASTAVGFAPAGYRYPPGTHCGSARPQEPVRSGRRPSGPCWTVRLAALRGAAAACCEAGRPRIAQRRRAGSRLGNTELARTGDPPARLRACRPAGASGSVGAAPGEPDSATGGKPSSNAATLELAKCQYGSKGRRTTACGPSGRSATH